MPALRRSSEKRLRGGRYIDPAPPKCERRAGSMRAPLWGSLFGGLSAILSALTRQRGSDDSGESRRRGRDGDGRKKDFKSLALLLKRVRKLIIDIDVTDRIIGCLFKK